MSAPRPIVCGATYLITRRVTERRFLLRPSKLVNGIFLYCLAFAARQTGVEVHGFVQMSNHWHGVVTDPLGRLPDFCQILHRLVACAMNAALGRAENFWSTDAPSYVRLHEPEKVLDELAYMMSNPVAAGLVADPQEWPGAITLGLGQAFTVRRPDGYFREGGAMPTEIMLRCTLPPSLSAMGITEAGRQLRRLVRERVQRATSGIRDQHRAFRGAARVVATPMDHVATTRETVRKRRPSFAAIDRAVREAAQAALRAFRLAYRAALDKWRAGDRAVRFPEGTFMMRLRFGVLCGPPQPAAA
jgi:REP-associated tyrosine transposase